MLVRIVKLSIDPLKIDDFKAHFDSVKLDIRNTPGNRFLELYQDLDNPSLFFTYSYWEHEEDLENYRQSDFFNEVWTHTKKLFNDKPEAWSVTKIHTLE